MRKLLLSLMLLSAALLLPPRSNAQYVVVGQACGASGLSAIANDGTPVVCRGNPLVWTAVGGGGGSPSNLTTFFNGYIGIAPQDKGAKGDGRIVFDGSATATQTTVSSAAVATCSTGDAGKVIELLGAGSAGATLVTTVSTSTPCANSTTWNITNTVGTTVNNKRLMIVTDDTVALQNWVTAINAAGSVHSGYLPRGLYYTTKPLRFTTQAQGTTQTDCQAVPAASALTLACTFYLTGTGPSESIIEAADSAAFQWGLPSTSVNNGVVYLNNFNSFVLANFCIQSNSVQYNISGNTGLDGGLTLESVAHGVVSNITIDNFRSSTNNLSGLLSISAPTVGDFESYYGPNIALEGNDIDGWFCAGQASATCEKIGVDTVFFENFGTDGIRIGSNTGTTTIRQLRLRNIHIATCSAASAAFHVMPSFSTGGAEQMVLEGARFGNDTQACGGTYFVADSGATGNIEIDGSDFNNNNVGSQVLWVKGPGLNVRMDGGGITNPAGNCVQNDSTTSFIYLMNVTIGSCTTKFGGTGVNQIFAFNSSSTGWTGPGVNQGTAWFSNQGTALATVTPGSGWGTSAAIAPCATRTGFANKSCFVITSGSAAFAAAPTLTVTLPTPLPSTATVCELNVHGITGAGGLILFDETTLSATVPAFTAVTSTGAAFTPAASETYTVVLSCGP